MKVKLLVEFMRLIVSYKSAVDQTDKVLRLILLVLDASESDPVTGLEDVNLDPFDEM